MKYLLLPVLKFLGSLFVLIVNLLYFIIAYPIATLWNFELMSWGDLLVCIHITSTSECYIKECDLKELKKETFWQTMGRWFRFEYYLLKID